MALYFRDENIKCDSCNCSLFRVEKYYNLTLEDNEYIAVPAKTAFICSKCEKEIKVFKDNGHANYKIL